MHAGELTQMAATVVAHAPLLIQNGEPFPTNATERYWTASKCRQENWGRALKEFSSAKHKKAAPISTAVECRIHPILEEVLTAEILCRVWAAVCSLADKRRGTKVTSAIAQNILDGHLETRNRVLSLMVYGYGLRVEDAVALNHLRIRNEHWTDTLLALMGAAAVTAEWAFQPTRARQLAISLRQQETAAGISLHRSMLLASLVAAYQRAPLAATPHAELNRRIASSILACFPPHVFDGTGQLASVQQLWLLQSSRDIQGRLELPAGNRSPSTDPPPFRRFDLS